MSKVILYRPENWELAEEMALQLSKGRIVIVNCSLLDFNSCQRLVDFLCGFVFAINGRAEKAGGNVIIFCPSEFYIEKQNY